MKNISQSLVIGALALGAATSGAAVNQVKESTKKTAAATIELPTLDVKEGMPQGVTYKNASGKIVSIPLEFCASEPSIIMKIPGIDPNVTTLVCASTQNKNSKALALAWKTHRGISYAVYGTGTSEDGVTHTLDKDNK